MNFLINKDADEEVRMQALERQTNIPRKPKLLTEEELPSYLKVQMPPKVHFLFCLCLSKRKMMLYSIRPLREKGQARLKLQKLLELRQQKG